MFATKAGSTIGMRQVFRAPAVVPRRTCAPKHLPPLLATRGSRNGSTSYNYNIHGRHVEVTPELEEYVIAKFSVTLEKLDSADYLEAEGGVQEVDIRLMNIKADISLKPAKTNKALHDTYLRMGELKAEGQGQNVYESFDKAAENLGKKLHKWRKASPQRKDMRNIGQNYRPSSNPGGRQGR